MIQFIQLTHSHRNQQKTIWIQADAIKAMFQDGGSTVVRLSMDDGDIHYEVTESPEEIIARVSGEGGCPPPNDRWFPRAVGGS